MNCFKKTGNFEIAFKSIMSFLKITGLLLGRRGDDEMGGEGKGIIFDPYQVNDVPPHLWCWYAKGIRDVPPIDQKLNSLIQ